MSGTRLSMMATVQARHSTITSLSGGKSGMTSTAGWPGRRAFARYAAIPCSIKSARKVNSPTSTRRPPYVNSMTCLGGVPLRYSGRAVRRCSPSMVMLAYLRTWRRE